MEDTDSSSTRKRPRLDSGERVYRSMSADPTIAAFSDNDLANSRANPADSQASSQLSGMTKGHPPVALTPSKFTINVRESIDKTSPTQSFTAFEGIPSASGSDCKEDTSQPTLSVNMEISSPKVISVSSSPSHSPEIEVAEVENMNDDPRETRWKTLDSTAVPFGGSDATEIQGTLLEQFPHHTGHNLKRTLSMIATVLGKRRLKSSLTEGFAADSMQMTLVTATSLKASRIGSNYISKLQSLLSQDGDTWWTMHGNSGTNFLPWWRR